MVYNKSLFIFTRDLRVPDNLALIEASKNSKIVYPIFVFTPTQTLDNDRFSSNCFQFMVESLDELSHSVPLSFFYGHLSEVVEHLVTTNGIDAIFISQDYTPFAIDREEKLAKIAKTHVVSNHTLVDIDTLVTGSGTKYTVYSAFKNKFKSTVSVPEPINFKCVNCAKIKGGKSLSLANKLYKYNSNLSVIGGRKAGLSILSNLKDFQNYNETRNNLSFETTNLSAYNKFGVVSIREVWRAINKLGIKGLDDQILWREFYYYILFNNLTVLTRNYNPKWDSFKWKHDKQKFTRWCNGETGFPIIDAGMRQLNTTGYMHNRVRLLVAFFLTKNLMIDWKHGEKYFSQQLVDYDPAQNNGNWQWAAGSGVDPLRYGEPRIMNPWSQSAKLDPDCDYIKKWIPELNNVECKDIHNWATSHKKYSSQRHVTYIPPMLDYSKTMQSFLSEFERSVKNKYSH